MPRLIRLSFAVLLLSLACQGDRLTPPLADLSDGAHNSGNPDFFFLPPLLPHPATSPDPAIAALYEPEEFNPNLEPRVEICEFDAALTVCSLFRTFAGGAIQVVSDHYEVNWDTHEGDGLDTARVYRINVLVGQKRLGFADVDPVANGSGLRSVQTDEFIGLIAGRTLPILFRIENGALCEGGECRAATINLAAGGGIELRDNGDVFRLDIPPQTQALWGGQPIEEVSFQLEIAATCGRLGLDLWVFPPCLRISTFFDVPQGTENATQLVLPGNGALVSMCTFVPGGVTDETQEQLITLHQRDGSQVRALPHVAPSVACIDIAAQPERRGTVLAGLWGLLTPRPLHAATVTRLAVLNLGGGGETNSFGSSSDGSSTNSARLSVGAAAVLESGANTVSDFQFALPAQLEALTGPLFGDRLPGAGLTATVRVTDALDQEVPNAVVRFSYTPPSGEDGGIAGLTEGACVAGSGDDLVCTTDGTGTISVRWTLGSATGAAHRLMARTAGAGLDRPFDSCGPQVNADGHIDCMAPSTRLLDLSAGTIAFTATPGAPDLIVTQLTHAPLIPTDADLIDFGVIVQNVGTAPAGPFGIVVATVGGSVSDDVSVSGLEPGDLSLEPGETSIRCCWHLRRPAGTYTQTATVDFRNEVAELRESNNTLTEDYAVTAVRFVGAVTDALADVPLGENDLVAGAATVAEGKLTLRAAFAGIRASTSLVAFHLDVDRNPATGFPGVDAANSDRSIMGVEFVIEMGQGVSPTLRIFRFDGTAFVTVPNAIPITFLADAMEATIPLDVLLGNKDGKVNFKVTLQRQLSDVPSFTGIFDYMPNVGAVPGTVEPPIP